MLELVFNSFVTLLVVVNPLGLAPIFAALARGYSEKRKREAAIRGTVLGTVILGHPVYLRARRRRAAGRSGDKHPGVPICGRNPAVLAGAGHDLRQSQRAALQDRAPAGGEFPRTRHLRVPACHPAASGGRARSRPSPASSGKRSATDWQCSWPCATRGPAAHPVLPPPRPG